LTATVLGLSMAIVIAALVDTYMQRGRSTFMAIYFSPTVTSTVAIAIVFSVIYGTKAGLLNAGLQALGLPAVRWLAEAGPLRAALIILLIWRWLGLNILYAVAGLQNISPELYEAAKIDGAVGLQSFFYITLPLLRRTILFMIVLSIIGMFRLFGEPAVLTQISGSLTGGLGGRDNAILTVVMLMLYNGFSRLRFGYAAAMSYVLFLVILVLSLINLKLFGERE
ncbi:MAG: sugar ABC transporter permease, partial [Spirochaetaceae bacterium]|nr:sugar ABC transporter permease [Spirochaetaceae bacterium]